MTEPTWIFREFLEFHNELNTFKLKIEICRILQIIEFLKFSNLNISMSKLSKIRTSRIKNSEQVFKISLQTSNIHNVWKFWRSTRKLKFIKRIWKFPTKNSNFPNFINSEEFQSSKFPDFKEFTKLGNLRNKFKLNSKKKTNFPN